MNRIVLQEKPSGETTKVVFDFLSRLSLGETISTAAVVATVYSGTDSTPAAIISGAASISGSQVTQKVTGGTVGVVYELTCTAVTSAAQTLQLAGYQVIL